MIGVLGIGHWAWGTELKFLVGVAAVVGGLIVIEASLRLLGFGNPPLYVSDRQIGYLLAPNQQVRRLGNRMLINQYSMRTQAIAPQCPANALRILLLGDSIANGGWWTDQNATISALMERQLEEGGEKKEKEGKRQEKQGRRDGENGVEVLNASANSWGPRNELAYLQRFGTFEAQVVVLLINTDDLFATAPTSLPIGCDRNYPDHKPPLALVEVCHRFLPAAPVPGMEQVQAEKGDRVRFNLEAIGKIGAIASQHQAQLLLALTPLRRELGETGPREYERKARQRLHDFTAAQNIAYLDFLPSFNQFEQPETLYRDHIHLSPQGNQLVSQMICQSLPGGCVYRL